MCVEWVVTTNENFYTTLFDHKKQMSFLFRKVRQLNQTIGELNGGESG